MNKKHDKHLLKVSPEEWGCLLGFYKQEKHWEPD